MVESEIDPYPVSQLTTRFGIGRTALYSRMNSLTITPTKQGGKAFVSSWQLQRLDALHEHLLKGGELADFACPALSSSNLAAGCTFRTIWVGAGTYIYF